jgi:hypothetical protein
VAVGELPAQRRFQRVTRQKGDRDHPVRPDQHGLAILLGAASPPLAQDRLGLGSGLPLARLRLLAL